MTNTTDNHHAQGPSGTRATSATRLAFPAILLAAALGILYTAVGAQSQEGPPTPTARTRQVTIAQPAPIQLAALNTSPAPVDPQPAAKPAAAAVAPTAAPLVAIAAPQPPPLRQELAEVRRGDTLSALLQRHNIALKSTLAVAKAAKPVFDLARKLQPGDAARLLFAPGSKGDLVSLAYPINKEKTLLVEAGQGETFSARIVATPLTKLIAAQSTEPPPPAITPAMRTLFTPPYRLADETVGPGDNLAGLLGRHDVPISDALAIARAAKPVFRLARRLKVGMQLHLSFDQAGTLAGLTYPMDTDHLLWVTRDEAGGFTANLEEIQYETRYRAASGIVDGALFVAGRKVGLSHNLVVQLAGLFEWDVDFARDIREGDSFKVVYEELFLNGEKVRDGEIVAASFTNQGETFKAVRYTDPRGRVGYYNGDGQSVRKMFIRAPVDFTRISSRFSNKRLHPVYGYTRAHKGVDYAAPRGTPVRAAGDGVVSFRQHKGGFGKLVIVRHNAKYSTAYAHLNLYASGLKVGTRVKQGEVIGQVGSTGTATGPHLHYEIRVYGKQANPLSIKLPSSDPVQEQFLTDFHTRSGDLLALLDQPEIAVAGLQLAQSVRK